MSMPLIDKRTAASITTALVGPNGKGLLFQYTDTEGHPEWSWAPWQEFDPATLQPVGASAALIGLFSRWAELTIERLNRVPDKNFVAFLNMLGAAQLPPEPARVPITFALAAGRTAEATVPQGTRVAAPADAAVTQPSVFELEHPLIVVAASLDSLVTLDPVQDTYADRLNASGASAFAAFQGDHRLEHTLYIGDDELFGYPAITGLRLTVNLVDDLGTGVDPREVTWERSDGEPWPRWEPITPVTDGTSNLNKSGTVELAVPGSSSDAGLAEKRTVGSYASRWLRCRLVTPITIEPPGAAGMVSAAQLPEIKSTTGSATDPEIGIDVEIDLARTKIAATSDRSIVPDVAFANGAPVDLGKEFYPFGEKPRRFDAFYVASRDAFSKDQMNLSDDESKPARITLYVTLANPDKAPTVVPPSRDLVLAWEYWDGRAWVTIGRSEVPPSAYPNPLPNPPLRGFEDQTYGLRRSGIVTLPLPAVAAMAPVNGEQNHFLRVRIIQGNYGEEAKVVRDENEPCHYRYDQATFDPPIIAKLSIGYELTKRRAPSLCVTFNEATFIDVTQSGAFQPFYSRKPDNEGKAELYLGLSLPTGVTRFPNTTLSLYASVAGAVYGETIVPLSPLVSCAVAAIEPDVDNPSVEHVLPAVHQFTITNASVETQTYALTICGQRWVTTLPDSLTETKTIDVAAGESKIVEITVDGIADNTAAGTADRAFLQISTLLDPLTLFTATLVTSVGHMPLPDAPSIRWEYWNGHAWTSIMLQRDDTENLTRPGLMQFTGPPDFVARRLFERERYWMRANFDPGDGSVVPRLRRLHLNTTTAIQSTTIVSETLGSSNGDEDQTFRTARMPVLAGQILEVREIDLPTAAEREILQREEGEDAVRVVTDAAGRPLETWVRWHEVPDFYGSGPRDRHYVIDHLTGEVRFGDGVSGWIPPLGANSVRMAIYRTGGGSAGNRAAGTVTQLKTTVPYVEKPTNPEPAAGGAESETIDAVRERMPRTLRHRDRAVTIEDYEDMAKVASLEVAHARCIPLRNLKADPLAIAPMRGIASVIVVPLSTDAKPLPSLELVSRVETFIEQRLPAGAAIVVVGPIYIRIDVTVEVALTADAVAPVVKATVEQRLVEFLHPLTGGQAGTGWDFGRIAHKSDLYPLIESVSGVDHARYLHVTEREELEGIRQTGCFLIYSGHHRIDVMFEDT